jgi:hypothetical protein
MNAEAGVALIALVVALGVAIVGWVHANRADERIADANRIAADALDLAHSAEARADRLERIAVESRDVQWTQQDRYREGGVTFQNSGSDTAYDVKLIVDPVHGGWARREQPHGEVPPAGLAGMNLRDIAREAAAGHQPDGMGGTFELPGALPGGPNPEIRVRITWRSGEGIPDVAEFTGIHIY